MEKLYLFEGANPKYLKKVEKVEKRVLKAIRNMTAREGKINNIEKFLARKSEFQRILTEIEIWKEWHSPNLKTDPKFKLKEFRACPKTAYSKKKLHSWGRYVPFESVVKEENDIYYFFILCKETDEVDAFGRKVYIAQRAQCRFAVNPFGRPVPAEPKGFRDYQPWRMGEREYLKSLEDKSRNWSWIRSYFSESS